MEFGRIVLTLKKADPPLNNIAAELYSEAALGPRSALFLSVMRWDKHLGCDKHRLVVLFPELIWKTLKLWKSLGNKSKRSVMLFTAATGVTLYMPYKNSKLRERTHLETSGFLARREFVCQGTRDHIKR